MELVIDAGGTCRLIYDETFDLDSLGDRTIERASHVEPTAAGDWRADLSPVGGPVLGPFAKRSAALLAETEWLTQHWLTGAPSRYAISRRSRCPAMRGTFSSRLSV